MQSCTVNISLPIQSGEQFQISGSLVGYVVRPNLEYQDGNGSWQQLPNNAIVVPTLYSFNHPGLAPTLGTTISIRDSDEHSVSATSATFPVAAIATESTSGSSINAPTATPIFDVGLNAYNLIQTSSFGLQITTNTNIDTTTANVILVLYYDHIVYYENSDRNFFSKLSSSSVWRQTTDPRISIPKSLTITTPNTITANVPFTVAGSLISYSITPVLQYSDNNGIWKPLPNGSRVTNIGYTFEHPGVGIATNLIVSVRDQNITTEVVSSPNIAINRTSESADNTSLSPGADESVVDRFGNFWSISPDGTIKLNGIADYTTANAIILYYSNHIVYYQNINQSWFKKPDLNQQWLLTTTPYINGPNSPAFNIKAAIQSVDFLVGSLQKLLAQVQPPPLID